MRDNKAHFGVPVNLVKPRECIRCREESELENKMEWYDLYSKCNSLSQASQAHVKRKRKINYLFIHICVTAV